IVCDHGIETCQPAWSAAVCWCAGNSARPRRNGDHDSLNAAWCFVRAGSKKTKRRRGIAGLRLVNFYVANRKQINRTARQSESECRQRWGGGGRRSERQIKLEIATRYFGQGGEQSRVTGAGGRSEERRVGRGGGGGWG